jgi:hypothetical protein
MKHFDSILDAPSTVTHSQMIETVIVEEMEVVVRARPEEHRQFENKPDDQWTWSDLRDYVVIQIEKRYGQFPRRSEQEYGIFRAFLARWGEMAPAIARYSFEVCEGRWHSAPISLGRFAKGSDPYFAAVIAERLKSL